MKSNRHLKSKKKINDKRSTINELHNNQMEYFENYYKTLPQKKVELEKIKNEINEKIKKGEKHIHNRNNIVEIKDKIKLLENEIEKIEKKTDMIDYLSRASNIFKKIEDNKKNSTIKPKKKKVINSFITVQEGKKKGNLLNEYIHTVKNKCISSLNKETNNIYICTECNGTCVFNAVECYITCSDCGMCKEYQDPNAPQWSEEVDVSKAYRYKRLGYFIEHLYRLQAKECTIIPQDVINKLLIELKKRRINDPNKITAKLIKGFLKNLDLNAYYDNINSIIRTLSGKPAPEFPEELEKKLEIMFMKTQEPFEKWKHLIPERNNYLSYPYVIRKLLIIIAKTEQDDDIMKFVPWFPLLKSRQKLWHQEKVWKKICESPQLKWPFIPSI